MDLLGLRMLECERSGVHYGTGNTFFSLVPDRSRDALGRVNLDTGNDPVIAWTEPSNQRRVHEDV
jgi:hypothetical protein